VPYAAAVIVMVVASAMSDRLHLRAVFVWPFLLVAAASFAGSYFARGNSFILSFVLLIVAAGAMYAPYGPYFATIPELFPAADAAPATGMINAVGGLGGFVGTYIVGVLGGADSAAPCLSPAAPRAAEPCGGGIRTQVHRDVDVRPYARFPTSAAAGPRSRQSAA